MSLSLGNTTYTTHTIPSSNPVSLPATLSSVASPDKSYAEVIGESLNTKINSEFGTLYSTWGNAFETISGLSNEIDALKNSGYFQDYSVIDGKIGAPYSYLPTTGVFDDPLNATKFSEFSSFVDSAYTNDFKFSLDGTYNQYLEYHINLWNSTTNQTSAQVCFYFYNGATLQTDLTAHSGNISPYQDNAQYRVVCHLPQGHSYTEVRIGVKCESANSMVVGHGTSTPTGARGSYYSMTIHSYE